MIFIETPEQYINHVCKVFSLLDYTGTTHKLKKCSFFDNKIDNQNHDSRHRRLELASHTTYAMSRLKPPTRRTEVRSFPGLCNSFWIFVPSFARTASPINQKMTKSQLKSLTLLNSKELQAMDTLEKALISLSVHIVLNFGEQLMLDTNACNVRIGCVLLQKTPRR